MYKIRRLLRRLRLVRHVKVTVYLRGGSTIKFKCKEWRATGQAPAAGNALQSYQFTGIKGKGIWFDITEIVAVEGEI